MQAKNRPSFVKRIKTNPCVSPVVALAGAIPALLYIALFSVIPALLNLAISFTDYNGNIADFGFVGFKNYIDFFKVIGVDVLPSFWTTIKYSLMVVLPLQVISVGAALIVNKGLKGSNFFRVLFFMPSILGSVVVCSSWKLIFDPQSGPLAEYFHIKSAFLGDSDWSLVCISIIALWASYGYSMTIYLAGLQGISRDYYEASEMDGANGWVQFFKITLPLLWPSVVICLWIAISGTLGMADYIVLTTGGYYNTQTIGFYIFDTVVNEKVNKGLSAATANYNFIFVTVIMLLYNYFIRKRVVDL